MFAAKPASDCCSAAVAKSASNGSSKAAYIPSPVIFMTTPWFPSTAFRDSASCSAKASDMRSPSCSHRRVLPSMSVNKRVVTPDDACTPKSSMAGRYSNRTLPLRATAANRKKSPPRSRIIALPRRVTADFGRKLRIGIVTSVGSRSLAQSGRITYGAQPGAVGAR